MSGSFFFEVNKNLILIPNNGRYQLNVGSRTIALCTLYEFIQDIAPWKATSTFKQILVIQYMVISACEKRSGSKVGHTAQFFLTVSLARGIFEVNMSIIKKWF